MCQNTSVAQVHIYRVFEYLHCRFELHLLAKYLENIYMYINLDLKFPSIPQNFKSAWIQKLDLSLTLITAQLYVLLAP